MSPTLEYNPAKAKALLDMFGFIDRDGDGYRDRPLGDRDGDGYRDRPLMGGGHRPGDLDGDGVPNRGDRHPADDRRF